MESKAGIWLLAILMVVGIALAITLGIYAYNNGGISETNIINEERLAEINEREEIENTNNENEVKQNELVATSVSKMKMSPNASVTEKRYYKKCDHLIREVKDIPIGLVNKGEEEIRSYYAEWKVEKCSNNEVVVYKEFEGICDEHYVIKDNNGILAIYRENDENVQEWQEDTSIETGYLPEKDIEEFKVGVKVEGKTNLYDFLEDYE